MSAAVHIEPELFAAGDVELQSGMTLADAKLAYTTFGALNEARDNVIVFPTRFGGRHEDNLYLIGAEHALDPTRYFIIVPNLLGNGVSSSPSTAPAPLDGPRFPATTIYDNVLLQRRLLLERFDIERVELVIGWSMGGQQAYQWGALFPDDVSRVAVICGAARTAPHTHVFLEGVKAALTCDSAFASGEYGDRIPRRGLRALGRVWAGWGLSQAFYRHEKFRSMGYTSLEDFLTRYWEAIYLERDANNLVSMIETWQACDLSDNPVFGGDYEAAMRAIQANVLVMPGQTDLYFPPEDSAGEVALLTRGTLEVIASTWGHYAGGGRDAADTKCIDNAVRDLLAD